jgi:transposase
MSISNINVDELLRNIKASLEADKNISKGLKASIETMILLIGILISRLGLNSRNSSKPPSSDPNRKKNQRSKSDKKPGGQKGRTGKTLEQVDEPDEIEELNIDRTTLPPGEYKSVGVEKRQVFDLDIKVVVTEYRAEILQNEQGERFTAPFPEGVTNHVQYGNGVKTHSVYLSQRQLIPIKRIEEYFADQIGLPLSVGSIHAFNQQAGALLKPFEERLKEELLKSPLLHADETGININGKRHWLHCNSSDQWTYLFAHSKRGKEAMDEMGVLEHYHGKVCHDHWKPYFRYGEMIHALCNAHHLRELTRVWEQDKQEWGKKMRDLLLEINRVTIDAGGVLPAPEQEIWRGKYRRIIADAEKECPAPEKSPDNKKRRGRQKRSKARNLLERLRDYETETLRFMTDADVSFTNNQGERDIRMTKVQQKISGCFRSMEGAEAFCRISSYLSSARKQQITASHALRSLFDGKDIFWHDLG